VVLSELWQPLESHKFYVQQQPGELDVVQCVLLRVWGSLL
jgi:hypothetical protein